MELKKIYKVMVEGVEQGSDVDDLNSKEFSTREEAMVALNAVHEEFNEGYAINDMKFVTTIVLKCGEKQTGQ